MMLDEINGSFIGKDNIYLVLLNSTSLYSFYERRMEFTVALSELTWQILLFYVTQS